MTTTTRHLTVAELTEGMEVLERTPSDGRPAQWRQVRNIAHRSDGRIMVQYADGSASESEPTAIVVGRDPIAVFPLADGAGWMVRSASLDGAFRHVSFDRGHFACTCPGALRMAETRRPCRHVRLVAEWEAATAPPARPQMAANVAGLTD